MEKPIFYLTGSNLTIENLMELGAGKYRIELSPDAWKRVRESRDVIENILKEDRKVYGVNTGFGNFADVKISPMNVAELQENLIRSHSAGVGNPLTLEQTRRLLALRINVLAKGKTSVSCVGTHTDSNINLNFGYCVTITKYINLETLRTGCLLTRFTRTFFGQDTAVSVSLR